VDPLWITLSGTHKCQGLIIDQKLIDHFDHFIRDSHWSVWQGLVIVRDSLLITSSGMRALSEIWCLQDDACHALCDVWQLLNSNFKLTLIKNKLQHAKVSPCLTFPACNTRSWQVLWAFIVFNVFLHDLQPASHACWRCTIHALFHNHLSFRT